MIKRCISLGVSPTSPRIYFYTYDDELAGRWPIWIDEWDLDILDLSSSGQDTALSRQQPEFKSPQVHLGDDPFQLQVLDNQNLLQPV